MGLIMDKKKITKVWLDESETECTMCGLCESVCNSVFEVPEKMIVIDNPDLELTDEIEESAEGCPVGTIAINYDGTKSLDENSSSEEGHERQDEYQ